MAVYRGKVTWVIVRIRTARILRIGITAVYILVSVDRLLIRRLIIWLLIIRLLIIWLLVILLLVTGIRILIHSEVCPAFRAEIYTLFILKPAFLTKHTQHPLKKNKFDIGISLLYYNKNF